MKSSDDSSACWISSSPQTSKFRVDFFDPPSLTWFNLKVIRKRARRDTKSVCLSADERQQLTQLLSSGVGSARVFKRARILQLLADGWAPRDISEAVGCSGSTIRRTRSKYEEGGLAFALSERPRSGAPRKVEKRQEAQVVAMVCTDPPEGRARWTVRLVTEEANGRGLVKGVGRERIRLLMRDHKLRPWREKNVVRSRTRRGIHRTDGKHTGLVRKTGFTRRTSRMP